ncbi:hypothetical protein [Streptomyces africanus]|uniref:hypothetical protein n=1 Tax=Streptomyces africanus TaxID=231024 RepID=UPI000A3901EA|nr:hypothetical protein [Streptomyces africanus]
MNEPRASVREISHRVYVNLPDRPIVKTLSGSRRKVYGLRLEYGIRRDISRVDITLEFHNAAEHFPPVMEMPEWMRRIVEANRPADVDNPDPNRRTGMGGWPLPAPTLPAHPDAYAKHDPDAMHAAVIRGLRAIGLNPEEASAWATAHQQDVLDRAGDAIDDEAWPHEKPEHENEELYRLADKVRKLLATETP